MTTDEPKDTPRLEVISAPDKLPKGSLGPYRASLSADGGTAPYHWSKTSGPDWLIVGDDGMVSGLPPAIGIATFSVEVRDSSSPIPQRATASISIEVDKHIWNRDDVGFWLAQVAWFLPVFGFFSILVYSFTTRGSHATYLGVGILIAIAALISGAL